VDGVRHPCDLHEIWLRDGHDVCEVSWRSRPGITRIETVPAADVWVVPRSRDLAVVDAEDASDA